MTETELMDLVDRHARQLGEHFEAVQILCSGPASEGGTQNCYSGTGNWFARQGMAHDFVQRDQAETLANKMPKPPEPPTDDEGEEWKKS